MESKSPPLLPPPSTAPSKLEPGGLKIAPAEQLPAGRPGDLLGSGLKAGGQQKGRAPAPRTHLPGPQPPVPLRPSVPASPSHAEIPGHASRGGGHEGTSQPRGAPEEGQGGGRWRGRGGGASLPSAAEGRRSVRGLRRAAAGGGERDAPAQPQLVPRWAAPASAGP